MNPVVEKIRALRELARGTTNENEARAAARQAARLAERHRIAEAEIEAAGAAPVEPAKVDEQPVYRGGAIPTWKANLVGMIAMHFGCAVVQERAPAGGRPLHIEQRMLLVGRASDVELAREAIAWLMLQVAALCNTRAIGRGRAFRSAWSLGCVLGIRDQLEAGKRDAREAAAAAPQPTTSTALVRLDERLAEAKKVIEDLPSRRSSVTVTDAGALRQGRVDGRRMPIAAATTEKRPVRALAGAS